MLLIAIFTTICLFLNHYHYKTGLALGFANKMLAFVLVENSLIRLYYCGALTGCVLFECKFL